MQKNLDFFKSALPKNLPIIEETLKKLAEALEIAFIPGLDRCEVHVTVVPR